MTRGGGRRRRRRNRDLTNRGGQTGPVALETDCTEPRRKPERSVLKRWCRNCEEGGVDWEEEEWGLVVEEG